MATKAPQSEMGRNTDENPRRSPDANERPPYIPWKSFDSFIAFLKTSHPPDVIDGGVMPNSMSGSLRTQVRSALRFLGLITNNQGKVSEQFSELIMAHGTPQWPMAVKEIVISAYSAIIGDLNIQKATSSQLDAKFKETGVSGQMLDKTVRFYLHALKVGDVKYSSYLSLRKQQRAKGPRKPKDEGVEDTQRKSPPPPANTPEGEGKGLIHFPLHFGDKPTGKISVPDNVDSGDMVLFDAMVAAVKAYAVRKKSGTED